MTTAVLRAVKIMGEGIEEIKASSLNLWEATREAIIFITCLIGPLLLPAIVMIGASY
jgi:hypothetical protein